MAPIVVGSMADYIDDMHRRGLKLSNLFEMDDGQWQANVRDGKGGFEFARATNPEDAMKGALLKAIEIGMAEAARASTPTPKPVRKPFIIVKKRA